MGNALDQDLEENAEEFYRSPTTTPEADPWALALEDIDLATGSIFKAQKHLIQEKGVKSSCRDAYFLK